MTKQSIYQKDIKLYLESTQQQGPKISEAKLIGLKGEKSNSEIIVGDFIPLSIMDTLGRRPARIQRVEQHC